MSNHAAKPRPAGRMGKAGTYFGIPALVIATIILAPVVNRKWIRPDESWLSFSAQVLGTRVDSAGLLDNLYGSSFLYRVEVHAAWIENGSRHDAGIPTAKTSRDKVWLQLWASEQSTRCMVRRNPRNPSDLIASF